MRSIRDRWELPQSEETAQGLFNVPTVSIVHAVNRPDSKNVAFIAYSNLYLLKRARALFNLTIGILCTQASFKKESRFVYSNSSISYGDVQC